MKHSLLVTGRASIPVEIFKVVAIERRDLETTHEEADVIIPRQVVDAATQGSKCIKVICDVFILLIHYYEQCSLTCIVLMEGTNRMLAVIDIGATAKQHADIAGQFLAALTLTSCDTVAFMWGIGKAKAVKVLLSGGKLLKMGNTEMPMDEVLLEATQFVARRYGCASSESMSATRYEVWIGKTSKRKVTGAPKLKSLPPTSEAFDQNVRRAHFQVSVWRAVLEKDPPELAPTNFGWEKDEASRSLLPVTIPEGVALAPMDVLKCNQVRLCNGPAMPTARCMCGTAQMSSTIFCGCHGMEECCNIWTKKFSATEEDVDSDIDDVDLCDD